MTNADIMSYALTTSPIMVDLRGSGRVMMRIDGADIRIAYDEYRASNGPYFTLADGTVAIFDPPNLMGDACWMRTASSTATLSVWKMGVNY